MASREHESTGADPERVSANLVICRLDAGGAVTIANPVADCDVTGCVTGYYV